MTHNEWLAGLAVGDKVVMESLHHEEVGQVVRFTKTQQIIVAKSNGHEYKFNRAGKHKIVGDRWHWISLQPLTEERERRIQDTELRNHALYDISDVDWPRLTNEELRAVLVALGRAAK